MSRCWMGQIACLMTRQQCRNCLNKSQEVCDTSLCTQLILEYIRVIHFNCSLIQRLLSNCAKTSSPNWLCCKMGESLRILFWYWVLYHLFYIQAGKQQFLLQVGNLNLSSWWRISCQIQSISRYLTFHEEYNLSFLLEVWSSIYNNVKLKALGTIVFFSSPDGKIMAYFSEAAHSFLMLVPICLVEGLSSFFQITDHTLKLNT
jgi:hypothetical protein